ncbi:hypothetical protein NDU88_004619 [Pleurodeles waltl]|uniref:Uncharacterized protein n=1 Tax=Pleurodeles waltl TaxID=8319 RepID=A0AAV7LLW7_PLEWA|nr:hypothetical protein NDU88_004619 [Pleurodeles waltl]
MSVAMEYFKKQRQRAGFTPRLLYENAVFLYLSYLDVYYRVWTKKKDSFRVISVKKARKWADAILIMYEGATS